jgi:hypothetical protein
MLYILGVGTEQDPSNKESISEAARRLHASLNAHFPLASEVRSSSRRDFINMGALGYSPFWTISHFGIDESRPNSTDRFVINIPVKGANNFTWIEYGIDPDSPELPLYRQGPAELEEWEVADQAPLPIQVVIDGVVQRLLTPPSNSQ